MAGSNYSYESDFYSWLSERTTPAQLSSVYESFALVSEYCLQRKILTRPLFETDDIKSLKAVQRTIEQNKIFRFTHRRHLSKMSTGIRQYMEFLNTHRKEEVSAPDTATRVLPPQEKAVEPDTAEKTLPPQEETAGTSAVQKVLPQQENASIPSAVEEVLPLREKVAEPDTAEKPLLLQEVKPASADPLIQLLLNAQIEFIDHRNKGGALWILDAEKFRPFVDQCAEKGIAFHYKAEGARATGGAATWWTKYEAEEPREEETAANPSEEKPADHPVDELKEQAKLNRRAWIDWMKAQGISSGVSMNSLLLLKQCGTYAEKKELLDRDIFLVSSTAEFDRILASLSADNAFVDWDKRQNGYLMDALRLFRANLLTQERSVGDSNENEQPASCASDSEVAELLSDGLFDPLRKVLDEERIYTIEDLKKVKLWPFMNQHDLYTIATRQVVLAKVQELLTPPKQVDSSQLWRLYCGEAVYEGETAAIAFLKYCESMARKFPLKIRTLLGKSVPGSSLVALHRTSTQGDPLRMENPTAFIQEDLTADEVRRLTAWLGNALAGSSDDVRIEEPAVTPVVPEAFPPEQNDLPQEESEIIPQPQKLCDSGSSSEKDVSPVPAGGNECSSADQSMIQRIETIVMQADTEGLTFDELRNALCETAAETRRLVALVNHIVDINGKLYHEDALIDWTEGADRLEAIMDKLMQKNNGYISAAQLYDYAHVDMNMFLNDNGINDERSVYDMAQHLFEKNAHHGKRYTFTGKSHIAASSDVSTIFDVCCKFAEDQGGFFAFSDLTDYLTSVGLKTGNLRGQMKIYTKPDFLYYEIGVLVLSKSLQINAKWLAAVRAALNRLFADVGDHIILREIQPFWFERLPALPHGKPWTPLLLQSVLRFYGEELGARTIIAMESQGIETLHTMLVQADSPIQSFGDVAISYIVESGIEQRSFEAEELREVLVGSGMIHGNELIWNMPKALGHDERFAWDASGDHVTVRV